MEDWKPLVPTNYKTYTSNLFQQGCIDLIWIIHTYSHLFFYLSTVKQGLYREFFFYSSSGFLEGVGKEGFEVPFVLFIPYIIYHFVGLNLVTLSYLASFHISEFCLWV